MAGEGSRLQGLVDWPDTEAGEGRRLERFVLAIEYDVWNEAGIDRDALLLKIFDALPVIVPDEKGDEGAQLQQAEIAELRAPSLQAGEEREPGVETGELLELIAGCLLDPGKYVQRRDVPDLPEGQIEPDKSTAYFPEALVSWQMNAIRVALGVGTDAGQQREPGVDRPGNPTVSVGSSVEAPEEATQIVVDFLDSWGFCPVSHPSLAARVRDLEEAASQLLTALLPAIRSDKKLCPCGDEPAVNGGRCFECRGRAITS